MAKRLFKDETRAYLAVCDHIGDFIITMGYLDAFKAYHGYERLTVIAAPKMEKLAQRYIGAEDEVICLNHWRLGLLLYLNTSHFTSQWLERHNNIWIMEPAGHFTDNSFALMLFFPGMNFRKLIQYGCLHLPEDASFTPLPLLRTDERKGGPKSRVVLCPQAQAVWIGNKPTAFFEELAERFLSLGKAVFTNLAASNADEQPLRGTQPLRLTLEELEDWLCPGDCVIGLRSGLMDYLAYVPCRLICLYPEGSRHTQFYSLDMLPQTRSCYAEYQLSGKSDEDLSAILKETFPDS